MTQTAAIEIEVLKAKPDELHVYPRATRRAQAQWAMWINPDGSGILFIGNDQVILPKNSAEKNKQMLSRAVNGEMRLSAERAFIACTDSACSMQQFVPHEFGKGCRLF